MKLLAKYIAAGTFIGFFTPKTSWETINYHIYTKLWKYSNELDILKWNHKNKMFTKIQNEVETSVPEDISKYYTKNYENGKILINFSSVIGLNELLNAPGMIFTYAIAYTGQGHPNIVHGGLSITLNEILAKQYFKEILKNKTPSFKNFEIKYRKPINTYIDIYTVAKDDYHPDKGKFLDFKSFNQAGELLQEYYMYYD